LLGLFPVVGGLEYAYWGGDLVGVSVPSADETDSRRSIKSAAPGGKTTVTSGTSFAAPDAAGIAAFTAAVNPSLTALRERSCLEIGATSLRDPEMGGGLRDAKTATGLAAGMPNSITAKLTIPAPGALITSQGGAPQLNTLVARRYFTNVAQLHGTLVATYQQFAVLAHQR
jgi:hypothetical protein